MNPEVSTIQELVDSHYHRWRGRDLAFFGGMFLVLVVIAAVIQEIIRSFIQTPMAEVVSVLVLTFLVEATLLTATYFLVHNIYGLSWRNEMRISFRYNISNRSLLVMGIGLALSVILVSALMTTVFPDLIPDQETPLEQLLTTPGSIVVFALFGIAIAPALEELMFRGFLFRVLEDVVGLSVAVWTSAAIFAVAHGGQLWPNWPAIIVILFVGYVLSKLRERTHSVIPGFIVHTVYNALLFLMFAFASMVEV
jgi:CAAX protease family protein